jgi:hypothetical protein
MSMSRNDFEMLAHALKEERPGDNWSANKRVQWNLDVKAVASVCKRVNFRFDIQKFLEACGGFCDTWSEVAE